MNLINNTVVSRGSILVNPDTDVQYELVRESRPVDTFGGNKLYSYNLRNVATGKMRRTENATPFGNDPLTVASLERAFKMPLVPLTHSKAIAKDVRQAVAKQVAPTKKAFGALRSVIRDLTPVYVGTVRPSWGTTGRCYCFTA